MRDKPGIGGVRPRVPWVEEEHLALLERTGLLKDAAAPELDRWTETLRGCTDAAVAAFSVFSAGRVVVTSVCTKERTQKRSARHVLSGSVEEYLIAQAASVEQVRSYLEAPVTVRGEVLGCMSIADHARRDWDDRDLQILRTVAQAASVAVELRLASDEAARVEELVVSHNQVHDLIARAVPLTVVLAEIVASIERHDPSVMGSVVLLDRQSSTLHPGAGASLPPDYLRRSTAW